MKRLLWAFFYWIGLAPVVFLVFLRVLSLPSLLFVVAREQTGEPLEWLAPIELVFGLLVFVASIAMVWWVWRRTTDSLVLSGVLPPSARAGHPPASDPPDR